MKERVVSLETREKMRQARLNKKWSEEIKEKMRCPRPSMIGNQNSKGHKPNSTSFKKNDPRLIRKNNPNWNGGISLNKRRLNEPRYIKWREKVFERDNYTCQECEQRGGNLESHPLKDGKIIQN